MAVKKAKPQTHTKIAEGKTAVQSAWTEPGKVVPENIPGFITNIHLADQVNNLTRQIYSSEPEVWVTDADGETAENLTEWLKEEFERLGCWNLMRYVIPDTYHWGCFVYSVGIEAVETGGYRISEIRHLPAESFSQIPPTYSANKVIPNPLMPGIIIDSEGNIEAWQTNRADGTHTLLHNVRFVRATGTPAPSGAAFLYPCYFLIARMDFAAQAQIQQVARIGAPRMIPKVKDDIDDDDYKALQDWFKTMGKFWEGKNNSILLPPGIEFPTLNIKEGTVAAQYIEQCVSWIRNYCNPMSDLTSVGGLGQSDSGRMEMWANFISAEQTLSEHWLESLFNYILEANGREGYEAHIELKRPSIDRSAIKLQALAQAISAHAITPEEIRDNLTDTLELKEWSEEIESELKTQSAINPYMMIGNAGGIGRTVTNPESTIIKDAESEIDSIYSDAAEQIKKTP